MRFDLIQSLSLAGDAATANDDRAGAGDRLAWIIDGATDLGPPGLVGSRGGAAWLAMAADHALAATGDAPIESICARLFAAIEARFARARTREPEGDWEMPSAALLVAHLNDAWLDCAWLGDCGALLRRGGGVERLGPAPDRANEAGAAARLGSGIGARKMHSPEVLADRRAARAGRDRAVLGVDAAASAARLRTARYPVAAGDELLLMTDGFAALVDVYGAVSESALIAATGGLPALAARLRAIELEDAACTAYPRFKPSDDATALWLRID